MYTGFQACLNWNHKLVEGSSGCFKQNHLHSVDHFFFIGVLPSRNILFSWFEKTPLQKLPCDQQHTYSVHLSWSLLEKHYLRITALVSPIPVLHAVCAPWIPTASQHNQMCKGTVISHKELLNFKVYHQLHSQCIFFPFLQIEHKIQSFFKLQGGKISSWKEQCKSGFELQNGKKNKEKSPYLQK